jgi:hypothetical protein
MDIANPDDFFRSFPNLRRDETNVTSPVDVKYNCIAWAAGEDRRWWWPSSFAYWPRSIPRIVATPAFEAAYATLGYQPTDNGDIEEGIEKVALYASNGVPTHAARQLEDGRWTSKCGKNVDMTHDVHDLEGPVYGQVCRYLARPRP